MIKYKKFLMISESNNNKYYEMIHESGDQFKTIYGRVELTANVKYYHISKWDEVYKKRIKNKYKDVTDLVASETTADTQIVETISDSKVNLFINLMKNYTDGLVSKTYSVKSDNVTEKQIKSAQEILDLINKISQKDQKSINDKLLELYTIIPRYMKKVQHNLLPEIDLKYALTQEQDNLDAIASQVLMYQQPKAKKKVINILELMGISKMNECKSNKEIDYLVKQCKKVEAIFEINKQSEDEIYDKWVASRKNKASKILIHGTRCSSVIPILKTNLQIRPTSNTQFSGKVYGEGNYFSEVVSKSLNYTGYDNDQILLVYEVHIGNPFVYDGWYRGNSFNLNFKELDKRGYDSTYVKAGNGLLNTEIIAYTEKQNRIKYILWLKK